MNLTKSLNPLVGAAALTAITVVISAPAQAFQVTSTNNFFTTESGATTLDFNGIGTPSASPINYSDGFATYTGNGRFVAGSIPSRFAEPPNNQPGYLTLGAGQEPGPVEINFAKALDYFGLYWGSIDAYNSIAFFKGNTLIKGFGNAFPNLISSIPLPVGGNQAQAGARYVNFFAENSSEWFDKIVLSSSQAAFESDNHAYRAVPTPAAVLPALIGMGTAAFRKKKREEDEELAISGIEEA